MVAKLNFRMCGHKYDSVVLDDRMFGFPFDRDIDFDLNLVKSRWVQKIKRIV